MVTFKFVPTKDDYLKSLQTFYFSNWQIWAVFMVLAFPLIICPLSAFIRGDLDLEYGGIFLFVFIAFLTYVGFVFVINPLKLASRVEKDERLNSPVEGEANDEHIMIKTKFSETKLDWGSFHKVIESKGQFLLVHNANKNMFQIIPKRAFVSIDDEKVFKNILAVKIPKNQKSNFDIKSPAVIIIILVAVGWCLFLCAFVAVAVMTRLLITG